MLAPALAAAAAFLAYLPALRLGFVGLDDPMFLLGQEGWRGVGPAQWAWAFRATTGGVWQPLAYLSYGLDHALWGMRPFGYHLTSALIHSVNAALVSLVAREVLRGSRWWAPLIAALLFALHPLRVESVAWVSERRDVLGAMFALGAILAHLRGKAGATIVLHGLGLLAKPQSATLPALLLALDWGQGRFSRKRALAQWPLWAMSAAIVVWTAAAQTRMRWTLEQHDLAGRAAQAFHGLGWYAAKTLWPAGLSPFHELRAPFSWTLYATLGLALAAAVIRFGRGRRWVWAGGVWYLISLAPMLGLTQFGPQVVADRYSYLSCLPFALAGALLPWRPALALAAGLGLAAAGQQRVWASDEALWGRVLEMDPKSATARVSLGASRGGAGDPAGAFLLFDEALALPDCAEAWGEADLEARRRRLEPRPQCRKARLNRGVARAQLGDRPGAAGDFEAMAELDPADPVAAAFKARLSQPR